MKLRVRLTAPMALRPTLLRGLRMNIEGRLSKLEAKAPAGDDWRAFRVIGESAEECQAAIDRLITSGEARATDQFMCRLIVDPAPLNSLPRSLVIGSEHRGARRE
jgi:hypothetical protein